MIFEKALKFVLKWEGGYVNNPNDKGGATNKGITQSTYNSWLRSKGQNLKDIRNITDSEVKEIYYNNYWLKAGCDKMSEKFAILSFDTAVNMGVTRVQEFLQYAKYTNPDKFIIARIRKDAEFSTYGNQKVFLQGWLNRVLDLETFINN
jgi:lysozyme family protein